MIKLFILILLESFPSVYAQSFDGCGRYEFRGILKMDESTKFVPVYIVNAETASEMKFTFSTEDEGLKVAAMRNTPSKFEGIIPRKMDGTVGLVKMPGKISFRYPDPLNSNSTGIKKLSDEKCD